MVAIPRCPVSLAQKHSVREGGVKEWAWHEHDVIEGGEIEVWVWHSGVGASCKSDLLLNLSVRKGLVNCPHQQCCANCWFINIICLHGYSLTNLPSTKCTEILAK